LYSEIFPETNYSNASFGKSIDFPENFAVSGAIYCNNASYHSGAVYCFEKQDNQ